MVDISKRHPYSLVHSSALSSYLITQEGTMINLVKRGISSHTTEAVCCGYVGWVRGDD
jgi:hypothetical protein